MTVLTAFIGAVFEIYIGNMFFSKFGDAKSNGKRKYAYLTALCILHTVSSVLLSQTGFMLLAFSLCLFLLSFLFKIKLLKKFLLTFAIIITGALSEMIVVMVTTTGMSTSVEILQTNEIMYFICLLLSKFLAFAILKPIKSTFGKSSQKFPLWFNLGVSGLPLTSVFIIVLLYRYSLVVNTVSYQISTLAAAILLILSNLLVLFVIDKQEIYLRTAERLSFAEAHIKNQIAHYSELYAQQEAIKKFRHDSKNFYTSLVSVMETLPPGEAVKYIKEKIDIDSLKDKTVNSGNPVIDAVIHAKNNQAQKSGGAICSTVRLANAINIDELELGVLIGNALDNAIDAISKLSEQNLKLIHLNICSSGDMLSIEVSNTTYKNIDVNNLKTTKKHKELHGYGLSTIEAITNKYNGHITITCENNVFTVSSILVNVNND